MRIIKALYGSGRDVVDVTQTIDRIACGSRTLFFRVDNDLMCSDPSPNQLKELTITLEEEPGKGERVVKTSEGEMCIYPNSRESTVSPTRPVMERSGSLCRCPLLQLRSDAAILVFIPDSQKFIDQFWGLYHSVVHNEDTRRKFKFVIVCKPSAAEKLPRQNCVFFLRDEELCDADEEKFKFVYSNEPYRYVNSFHHFFDEEIKSFLRQNFHYLLRLDVDTFVTPNSYMMAVEKNEIMVGNGGYSTEKVLVNLEAHSDKLNIPFRKDVHAVGSTWFGHTEDVIELGEHTIKYVRYLLNEDNVFQQNEGAWPDWYAGVILLYAGHLACASSDFKITKSPLDVGTAQEDGLDEAYTLHCWHSEDYFSKFMFSHNKYDDRRMTRNDYLNSGNLNDYALYCALSGKLGRQAQYLFPQEEVSEENQYILEKLRELITWKTW